MPTTARRVRRQGRRSPPSTDAPATYNNPEWTVEPPNQTTLVFVHPFLLQGGNFHNLDRMAN